MLTGGTLPELFPLIMVAAVVVGGLISRRYKAVLPLSPIQKAWIGMAAFSGALLSARIPYLIPGLPGFTDAENILLSSKTILFGMVGGYFAVELAKWHIGLKTKTGDTFVVPVAASIAIGRIACFCGGCCYGTPTDLPWGVVFPQIDKLPRHPTQLYESLFHLTAAFLAAWIIRRGWIRGQVIKLYFLTYFGYRFVTEFVRPEAHVTGGLTAYQWSIMVFAPVFVWLWIRDRKAAEQLAAARPEASP